MSVGVYQRTDEHRHKISVALTGRTLSDETKAKIRARLTGRKCGPRSDETKRRVSTGNKGKKRTAGQRLAMSLARAGKTRRPWSDDVKSKISSALLGRKRPNVGAKIRRSWEDGRHCVRKSYRYTSLAQSLHSYLATTAGLTLEPEIRFGRFTVDLYDRAHHVAYEADGKYWHERHEAENPGFHANRDAYLMDRFWLQVVHFDDVAIREMVRRTAA